MRQALVGASHGPGSVAALQMHGTGTSLGDPIEVGAAVEALLEAGPGGSSVPEDGDRAATRALHLIGSKSTVGHAEPAAGITGLVYAVRQVRAGKTNTGRSTINLKP
jgi:acyl transferase domain-containing protein